MDYKEKAAILRACSGVKGYKCSGCPAFGKGNRTCRSNAMKDGADCIEMLLDRAETAEARAEKAEVKLHYAMECVAGLSFILKAFDGNAKMDTVVPMARRLLAEYNERFPPAKLKLNNQGLCLKFENAAEVREKDHG